MKNRNKRNRHELKKEREFRRMATIMIVILCAIVFFWYWLTKPIVPPAGENRAEIESKAIALGIPTNWPFEIRARHVWISENATRAPKNPFFQPVHIVYRPNDSSPWRFNGNGTILLKKPGWLATAHHVFEDRPGEYGYRQIGPEEFTGTEPVIPILSCDENTNSDDAILCHVDPNGKDFPRINVVGMGVRFTDYQKESYQGLTYPAKIHFLTYPADMTINGVFWVEVRPGVMYIYFDDPVVNGESGTGATIETEDPDTLMVVVREHEISEDMLSPEDLKKIGWYEGRRYGIGHLIKIK